MERRERTDKKSDDPRIDPKQLGTKPDRLVAADAGVPVDWVRRARERRGIPAYRRIAEGFRIREDSNEE